MIWALVETGSLCCNEAQPSLGRGSRTEVLVVGAGGWDEERVYKASKPGAICSFSMETHQLGGSIDDLGQGGSDPLWQLLCGSDLWRSKSVFVTLW